MKPEDRDALRRLLERPALRRLWSEARAQVERWGEVRGTARLESPEPEERRAVADLLGLRKIPPTDRPLRVRLVTLDRRLRESRFAVGLERALALHGGELRNRPAEREEEEASWRRFWRRARRDPRLAGYDRLEPWLRELESTGLLRRLVRRPEETPDLLLDRVLTVLEHLPGEGSDAPLRLPVLASRALGDSHALDTQHRVPALVLRALARLQDRPMPQTAAERRELWQRYGVICDDLSCDVLVLGLRPPGDGLLPRTVREHARAGEPLRVTLRQLTHGEPLRLPAPGPVYACENPAVVSVAADRLGPRCPPLLCLHGQPDTAALVLLRDLAESGADLRYHGDFDWGGLTIANTLHRAVAFRPWRYATADYLAGVERVAPLDLHGRPVDAAWDPSLRPAMEEHGRVIEEEAVIDRLIDDLLP